MTPMIMFFQYGTGSEKRDSLKWRYVILGHVNVLNNHLEQVVELQIWLLVIGAKLGWDESVSQSVFCYKYYDF